jgi:hypothetical protein
VCGDVEWTEKTVVLLMSMYYPSINLEELRKPYKISVSILCFCHLIIALPFYSMGDFIEGCLKRIKGNVNREYQEN